MQKRFVILDGSSLLFRAFYALPPLTAPTGEYTNAIFGFANMFLKLWEDWQPDYLVLAFDKGKKTFRTELYPEYKGTREKTPAELLGQIPLLHEFAGALGMPFIELAGFEADDIIGTLSTQAATQGVDTLVVTGDRDALQLVRPNLRVALTKKGISQLAIYDEAAFTEAYQLPPIRLIDLKGLMGDTSDNIPGVPGVGPKTATKLLLEYGSLENVLEHVEEVSGKKLRERLATFKEQARLSKVLATIDCHVPDLKLSLEEAVVVPDPAKLASFCKRYGMTAILARVQKLFPAEPTSTQEMLPADSVADTGKDSLRNECEPISAAALKVLSQADCLAVSAQFTGQPPFLSLSSIEIACSKGLYRTESASVFPHLFDVLETTPEVILFDLKMYGQAGIRFSGKILDAKLAAYLLHPEASTYSVTSLWEEFFPETTLPDESAATDALLAEALFQLRQPLRERLVALGLWQLYETVELPLVPVLVEMEQTGVYVNREHLAEKAEEVGQRIEGIEQDIYTLAGTKFNIKSPKQLGEILFERLGLPPVKKTKTGYSTNAEVLETLRFQHPIVEQILSYRLWTKLKSTYLDAIGDLIHPESGRVHTSFNQTVTATGRLSSSDPNLQNIPVRTEQGRQIRTLFEPGEGFDYLLSADYSQIELRLLAHMSGDENFIDAFCKGQDIHARTAAEVFHLPLSEVTPELRRRAKAVNFGIVYGISDYGLARDLHISRKEAAGYIEEYFTRYPGVKGFLDEMIEKAHATGVVTTLFGRRRELPAIKSRNFNQRSLAERMAMNTPIQGTAADIIKLAMIRADRALKEAGAKSRLLLQVHDELVLEVPASEVTEVTELLREAMEHVVDLSVPLLIDVKTGKNWAEAK